MEYEIVDEVEVWFDSGIEDLTRVVKRLIVTGGGGINAIMDCVLD